MKKQHWLRSALLTGGLATAFWLGMLLSSHAQSSASEAGGARVINESGGSLFRTYCAACHGLSAKGDGPLADSMRRRPADLTEIAKRNGGVFPTDLVFKTIDGRQPVRGHGGPDMPVWGDAFRRSIDRGGEEGVREKIGALVSYLESIQARSAF